MTEIKEDDFINSSKDTAGNNIYKQGRARKINDNNFYLTIRYLSLQTFNDKRLAYHELKDEIRELDDIAPGKKTSKAYLKKLIGECEERISSCKTAIFVNQFSAHQNKEYCEKVIKVNKDKIKESRDNYIELSDKIKFDLHSIVVKLDDEIYSAMNNWIKQQRYREKAHNYQVTLSAEGKVALQMLKKTLGADSYDETLIRLNKKIVYGDDY